MSQISVSLHKHYSAFTQIRKHRHILFVMGEKRFIPGLTLNRLFYEQIVGPLLNRELSGFRYAAGLVGRGSDVFGFDSPTSMDHNWGPQFRIMLPDHEFEKNKEIVDKLLKEKLPPTFMGFPTNFTPESDGYLKRQMKLKKHPPINHGFKFFSLRSFFVYHLAYGDTRFNPYKRLSVKDWLTFPEQCLLEAVSGDVYHDEIGLNKMRKKYSFYPKDIWLYLMGVQWGRMGDEMSFPGRSAEAGDEVGSRILASNMCRHIMQMCFFMERRYAPYKKWFGTAFSRLRCGPKFIPHIEQALTGKNWEKRQEALAECFLLLRGMHNDLKITKEVNVRTHDFHGRGYKTIDVMPFLEAIGPEIKTKRINNLKYKLGSVTQFVDHSRLHQIDSAHIDFRCVIK